MDAKDFEFPRGPMTLISIELADKTVYKLHAELLKHHSIYFRRTLNTTWTEMVANGVELYDQRWASAFPILVEWIYSGGNMKATKSTNAIEETWNFCDTKSFDHEKPTWKESVNLWYLANFFGMPKLQNCVMDLMCKKLRGQAPECPPTQLARYVWMHREAGTPKLWEFVGDVMTNPRYLSSPDSAFQESGDMLEPSMALDLLKRQIRYRSKLYEIQRDSKILRADVHGYCGRPRGPNGAALDQNHFCECNLCMANKLAREVGYLITNEISASKYYVEIPNEDAEQQEPTTSYTPWLDDERVAQLTQGMAGLGHTSPSAHASPSAPGSRHSSVRTL
ncbi:Uu.00g054340.m01.CDS01 [Anthostomella pinea]|uniref:Uu.00g054340.m01.CDS01 n=1 Tax=Anthostomella pinea TaxID=933095 RepID=A0AAI8VXB3_9PEZI|nr:Uu.00g054340.m01.CDS01 [Anthostomella pinea]